ncbi:MAG: hypothetical protein IJ715_05475 [Bacilli bacterium]|nr:hypothetical protein [Bacilli bacterium]
MKKILLTIMTIIMFSGCSGTLLNTPTKKVEMFFNKYQSLDDDVMNQLKDVVNNEISFTKEQGLSYIEIMKKHYQSLKYRIKDEVIDGNTAVVTVEIEVIDYSDILKNADNYLKENESEFMKNGKIDEKLFNDYRLNKLKSAKDKVKYTIDMTLTNVDGKWELDEVSRDTKDKIHGVYYK